MFNPFDEVVYVLGLIVVILVVIVPWGTGALWFMGFM